MSTSFPGFSQSFFTFFTNLAANNNRPWFNENKERYRQDVVAPISDFIEAMAPRLKKISPHYVADPRPNGGSMFRIYKDVRFSKDKKPYKEHGACQFRHTLGKDAHAPGFYVHLEPGKVIFGGGVWKPASPQLALIRDAIDQDQTGWKRVINNNKLKDTFGGIAGDGLVRPPRGYEADHPHIVDLKRQSFFAMRHEPEALARSDKFIDEVEAIFEASAPLLKFLNKGLGVAF